MTRLTRRLQTVIDKELTWFVGSRRGSDRGSGKQYGRGTPVQYFGPLGHDYEQAPPPPHTAHYPPHTTRRTPHTPHSTPHTTRRTPYSCCVLRAARAQTHASAANR